MGRTITLDDDVAEKLEREAERTQKTLDEVVNEAVREKLNTPFPVAAKPFRVRARNMGAFKIDLTCTSRALAMLDEMEEK